MKLIKYPANIACKHSSKIFRKYCISLYTGNSYYLSSIDFCNDEIKNQGWAGFEGSENFVLDFLISPDPWLHE